MEIKDQGVGRIAYLLDYGLDEAQFQMIVRGEQSIGRLNQDWAAARLLEFAPYEDIIRIIGYSALVQNWPRWRAKISSESRRRGLDFLSNWLLKNHPELCV